MVRLIFPGRFKSTRGRGAFAATDSMRRLCQESRHFPSFGPFRVHFLARIHLFWSYHTVSTRGFAGEGATGQVAMLRPFLEFPATVPFPRLWATDVHTSHPQECHLVVNSVYPGCRARLSPVARRPSPAPSLTPPSPLSVRVRPSPSLAFLSAQPKRIEEIKEFLLTARRKDARSVKIMKTTDGTTKFKVRCSRYLYTLCVKDSDKADKLKQSLPSTLQVSEIKRKGE